MHQQGSLFKDDQSDEKNFTGFLLSSVRPLQVLKCIKRQQAPVMATRFSFDTDLNQVIIEAKSCLRKVILNRPQQLNCLTYEMIHRLRVAFQAYEHDPEVKLLILKGAKGAFCAGGDVVRIVELCIAGDWHFGAYMYKQQLILDHLLATYKKPIVFLIDGVVMGGGAGLSMNGRFRVVTENTVFAMPEVTIGHFPDVGASYFLSRLPGHFGEYLGLTGAKLNGSEMLACGLATHFVHSKDLEALENELSNLVSVDASTISEVIGKFMCKPHVQSNSAYKRLDIIDKCFSKNTIEEILILLEHEVLRGEDKWISKVLNSMISASPTSLKLFLRSIRDGRKQNLEECLAREYTISCHVLRRTVNSDFFEGARAIFFDKDKRPKWDPPKLAEVSDDIINQFFTDINDDRWNHLKFPNRHFLTDIGNSKL